MRDGENHNWVVKLVCSTIAIIAVILAACYGYSMVKKAYVMNSEDVVKQKQRDAYEMRKLLSKDTDEAYDSGYYDGREEGYKQGYEEGYAEGEDEGYAQGHDDGYEEGYDSGYEWGFEEGYVAAEEDYGIN